MEHNLDKNALLTQKKNVNLDISIEPSCDTGSISEEGSAYEDQTFQFESLAWKVT